MSTTQALSKKTIFGPFYPAIFSAIISNITILLEHPGGDYGEKKRNKRAIFDDFRQKTHNQETF